MAIGKLVRVTAQANHTLELVWDDELSGTLSLSGVIDDRTVLAPLRDAGAFAAARLSDDGWSVEWPSEIDFGVAQLRHWMVSGLDTRAAA